MTRKCVLCKETNYKNTYSFFSAPKDPEMRKKWEDAIGIENYSVTDDTYVCSKHFHKDDIITHWVSGVPPHVITIKYKKCRLRPGAVPGKDLDNKQTNQECSDDSDINMSDYLTFKRGRDGSQMEKRTFAIPRTEENSRKKEVQNSKSTDADYRFSSEFEDYKYGHKDKKLANKSQFLEDTSNISLESNSESKGMELSQNSSQESCDAIYVKEEIISDSDLKKDINSADGKREQSRTYNENSYSNVSKNVQPAGRIFNNSEGDDTSTEMWEYKTKQKNVYAKEKPDNTFKSTERMYMENQVLDSLNYDSLDVHSYSLYNDGEESEMLFEDLLEVCTEIILPRGWSCLVTSKGHTTTVVYLYMGMTKGGMPFAEKQVFVKSDMILRCAAVNREINPLIHNLIRDGKHLKVHTLTDVEELIDEFDQRIVCQGIYNVEGFQDINGIKGAYNDGVKWRHLSCPLIVNNDSPRCTRCITLSHMLVRKSKSFLPFRYNPPIFLKKQQKLHTLRQIRKRTRKHDRRYDFIKVFKK